MESRMTIQKKATLISSSVAGLLALLKLIVGMVSGSVAVLASAIDSLLDLGASLFNYFAIHNAEKPADETFNYGRGKLESLASVSEGVIITLSGLYILYESITKIINGSTPTHLDISLAVMAFSFVVTTALVLFLNRVAKKTNNIVIKSDALHYKTDVYSNGAVLLSLAVIGLTDFGMIDAIMGLMIGVYIIYSASELIKEGVLMLMDVTLDEETVHKITAAIREESLVTGYHHLKTRRAGKQIFVDVHLVFTPDISLMKAHHASDDVEDRIRLIDTEAEWVINIHLDPVDDS